MLLLPLYHPPERLEFPSRLSFLLLHRMVPVGVVVTIATLLSSSSVSNLIGE